ncbi:MAG: BatD family protein [bacterium]
MTQNAVQCVQVLSHSAGKLAVLAVSLLCLVPMTSCSGRKVPQSGKATGGVERKVELGPVSAIVKLDKAEITIADRVNLTIEVRAREDYDVELPPVGEKLEQFGIVDYHTSQPQLVGTNEVITRRSYVLEPFLSGDYTIKPFKVTFRKKSEAADVTHKLDTGEMTVKVTSLLPDKLKALKINDIAAPVRLPRFWKIKVWVAVLVGVVLVAAIAAILIVVRLRRSHMVRTALALPPHEVAYRRLEELVREDLVGKGQIKLFYQRISDILRHYIEDRFGLHAPERTTEEFLYELGAGDVLVIQH